MSSNRNDSVAASAADPEARRVAVARIRERPAAERVSRLLAALGDEDWRVRKEAVGMSTELGPLPELLSALADALSVGENVGLSNAAVEALGAFGDFAVEILRPRLAGLDADGKKLAIEALARSAEPSALELLGPLLADADANVRVAALEALGAVGGSRIEETQRLLLARVERVERVEAGGPLETLAALESLSRIGARLPFAQVEPWLQRPLLARSALGLAANSGDPRAASALCSALTDRDPLTIRALADYVLGSEAARRAVRTRVAEGFDPLPALSVWLSPGADDVEGVRAALAIVGALGLRSAALSLRPWLADARCYAEADQALFSLGAEAWPVLQGGLLDPDVEIAAACLNLIGRLPDDAIGPGVRDVVTAALASPEPEVVASALGALTRIGDAASLPDLVRLLAQPAHVVMVGPALSAVARRHPESALAWVRSDASAGPVAHAAALVVSALASTAALARFEPQGLGDFLAAMLMSPSPAERCAALIALGELRAGAALHAVNFALVDEEVEVRLEAVRALGRLQSEAGIAVGVPALLEVVAEARDAALLVAALRALGESSDPRATAVLGSLVSAPEPSVAVTAVEALSRHADPRRLAWLFDALGHPEAEVVKAAMRALSTEADPRVIAQLGACLDQSAWDVRRLAADLLGRSAAEAAHVFLRARLGVEHDPMVREALLRALEDAGPQHPRRPSRRGTSER